MSREHRVRDRIGSHGGCGSVHGPPGRRRILITSSEGNVMVRRDKVVDARGRSWVSGKLGSEEYFAEARRIAQEQARRSVAARLTGRTVRRAAS